MPSPKNKAVSLFIQSSQWLEPDVSKPLKLPYGIEPGQEVGSRDIEGLD